MSDIFKREMNWSTYQDKQLGVLKSLEHSFESSLRSSRAIQSSLDKTASTLDSMLRGAEHLASILSNATGGSGGSTTRASSDPYDLNRMFEQEAKRRKEEADKEQARRDEAERELEERNRRAQAYLEKKDEERERADRDFKEDFNRNIEHYGKKFLYYVADIAKAYSETRNTMIQASGIIGNASQELRGTISRDITSALNDDTGNFYSPKKVYEAMTKVSSDTNIGTQEILEDLTRPILLAQESMNVDTTNLAEMFGRWSKKYNFSSAAMEEMVDEIRGNTAGNNASEAAAAETLNKLQEWIVYSSRGDEDKMSSMSKGLTTSTSWLTDMGIDSSYYDTIMEKVLSGEAFSDKSMLAALGSANVDIYKVSDLLNSGTAEGVEQAYQYVFDGIANLFANGMDDTVLKKQVAEAFGYDVADLLPTYNSKYNNKNYQSVDEFAKTYEDGPTAAETVESKHLGLVEKIKNNLDSLLERTATWQEKLGIDISEILTGLLALKGMSVMFNGMKGGFNTLFSGGATSGALTKFFGKGTAGLTGGLGGSLGGVGSTLGAIAPALGVAGAAVGVFALLKAIGKKIVDDDKDSADPYQGVLSGTEEDLGYGYGYKGTYDSKTGKTTWNYSALSAEDSANYDKDKAFSGYLTEKKENMSLWSRLANGVSNDATAAYMAKAYGVQTYDDKQREVFDSIEDLITSGANRDMISFYTNKGLLNTGTDVNHFSSNIDKYEKYWNKGLYLAGKNWYTVDGDTLVTDGAPKAFAVGTNYIDSDQLAFLHEGEAVVPKKYNPAANMNELEMLRNQMKSENAKSNKSDSKSQTYMKESLEVLTEIKEFMELWKSESFRRTDISERKNRINTFASSYMKTE